jgi:4-diphosphocytidyl-2-C-methyl-D-erythritol kinase
MSKTTTAGDRRICFRTPAKINTFLYLQRIRPDGYHELLMDLVPITLFDRIELNETRTGTIDFQTNLAGVAKEDNLAVKAIRVLEKETKTCFSLAVNLTKNIPTGAGLGGGSGNAAGILVVLNHWYDLQLSQVKLQELALKLGTDVPFFINPRPSLAEGIGDRLSDLPSFEPLHLVLLYPGFPISTGYAYANCHISGRSNSKSGYTQADFANQSPGINDFWLSLAQEFPQLTTCRQALLDQGAVFAGLSGSGSTVFGIYRDEATCLQAFSKLKSETSWKLFPCTTLPGYSYFSESPRSRG